MFMGGNVYLALQLFTGRNDCVRDPSWMMRANADCQGIGREKTHVRRISLWVIARELGC